MCPDSNRRFEKAKAKERKEMMNACFLNVKLTKLNSDGCLPAWAVTTTLTLALNGNDYISAHEKGHGLSRKAYFSICSRNYKVIVSPFGLRMILTD